MALAMLTTTDNPYNPFDDFDNWYRFDEQKGYHSSSYLARIVKTYQDEGWEAYEDAVEQAIDEIVGFNLTGNYMKIIKDQE